MEDLELEIKGKKLMFSDYIKGDEIELEVEDEYNDSVWFYLDKENIIKIRDYLEGVLKNMASNV